MTDRLIDKPLTNGAYGFPRRGARRRVAPVILGVAHITGNSRTAAYEDPLAGAAAERAYANRKDSPGPSAHLYIGRDGRGYRAIDWRAYAAWSNGDVNRPDRTNPGIVRGRALRARGYNFNEACGVEAELVGYGTSMPVTPAQRDAFAEELARAARHFGLPINRETVVGHYAINGVDRQNCPVRPAGHNAFLDDLVARARSWYGRLYPVTPPDEESYPMIVVTDRTPRTVRVKQGATLYDLNGKPAALVRNDVDRPSPAGTADGRLVLATIGAVTQLVLARSEDVTASAPADATAEVAKLTARLREIGAAAGSLRSAGTSTVAAADSIVALATGS